MFDRQGLTSFEKVIQSSGLPRAQKSVLAGTSRAERLSYRERQPEVETVLDVAAGLVSPLAFLFVWWALWRARKDSISRIYCLARDGEIFFKVARALIDYWNLDIEVQYLYCSRESLLAPSFNEAGLFEENWVTWGYQGNITANEFRGRLDLSLEAVKPHFVSAGLEQYIQNPELNIPFGLLGRLKSILAVESFQEKAKEALRPKREATLSYLRQEGLVDGESYALLDTGWTGSSQYAIGSILSNAGHLSNNLTGYYLGVNREAWVRNHESLKGFLFDWRTTRRDEQLYNFICYELLFSGLHERTTGYRLGGKNTEVIFGQGLSGFALAASGMHHDVAESYARKAANLLHFEDFSPENSSALCRKLIREFICRPSVEIANVYGDWPMASEIREVDMQCVAPRMDFMQFMRNALGKEKIKGYWPQASLRRGMLNMILYVYNLFLSAGLLEWYRKLLLRY